jgi:predicted lipoprotein with Yx(FWY)xxD motif
MQTKDRSGQMRRRLTALAALALVGLLAFSVAGGVGGTTPTKRVVKVGTLSDGTSVLANLSGRTLYSLSVEKHGKFICTGGCLSIWHPLVVAKGVRPTGPVTLGTVKRPDGKTQVTYRGRPLYSFADDTKAGQANGEGIKDVGTWHAAKPPASSSQPTEPQPVPTSPYPTSPQPTESAPQSPPTQESPYQPPYPY